MVLHTRFSHQCQVELSSAWPELKTTNKHFEKKAWISNHTNVGFPYYPYTFPDKNPIQCLRTNVTLCLPSQSNQENCSSTELERLSYDRQTCSGLQRKSLRHFFFSPPASPWCPAEWCEPPPQPHYQSADDTHQTNTHSHQTCQILDVQTVEDTGTKICCWFSLLPPNYLLVSTFHRHMKKYFWKLSPHLPTRNSVKQKRGIQLIICLYDKGVSLHMKTIVSSQYCM